MQLFQMKKLEELKELCDVMLVEADGAKHHPVKVPAEWEPVIPACADLVISVIGLDCLGQPISQSAYRMERTSEISEEKSGCTDHRGGYCEDCNFHLWTF